MSSPAKTVVASPPAVASPPWFDWLCLVLAIIFAFVSYPDVFVKISSLWTVKPKFAESFPWGEAVASIITNYQETARMLLQSSVGLIAASWGIVAIQHDYAKRLLRTGPRQLIFIIGTLCLLFSCYSYLRFNHDMTFYLQIAQKTMSDPDLKNGAIPDLQHGTVIAHLNAQVVGIGLGALCIALPVVSSWKESR
jgi:hypothetical protein